jgi:two-component system sensor histidine kinase KdpD
MLATRPGGGATLSREEESSLQWAIDHEKPVELTDIPLISRPRGSYLRWNLPACAAEACPVASSASYITPLLSGTKVVGGARFLVADNTHPRFTAFKKSLKTQRPGSSSSQFLSNLLLELLKQAVSLIEQALIEQALKDQENRDRELWERTQELYNTIITSVHHDLKTPLTQIRAAASNLLSLEAIWQDEAERRSLLTEIINEVDEQTRTINRMLELSRIEQGALDIGKELFPVEEIVRATVESTHICALLQGRRLVRKGLEDLPPVDVDFVMIKQVLVNLIENAVRYTPAGSPIEIHGHSDGKQIYISVIDHGPGIPQAEQERIFEKFYRIVEDENQPLQRDPFTSPVHRTGLGLAVCRGFIEAHNGRIWVESPDSGGARFKFTLPLRQKG